MRRAAKIDTNQPDVVAEFRALGCTVTPTHMIGRGFVDIVVGVVGINLLVEIKDGDKVPSARKLTPDEQVWHDAWKGQKAVVETLQDVRDLVCEVSRAAC